MRTPFTSVVARCPKCRTALSVFRVRSRFECPTCGVALASNARVLEVVTLVLVAIATISLHETWVFLALSVIAIAVCYVAIYRPLLNVRVQE